MSAVLTDLSPEDRELAKYIELRRLVDIFYDVQLVRMMTASRERGLPGLTESLYSEELKEVENRLFKEIKRLIKEEEIWTEYLHEVRGVGPTLAGAWISYIMIAYKPSKHPSELQKQFKIKAKGKHVLYPHLRGIGAFDTVSKLWKYCGLDVEDGKAPKRVKGKKYGRNPKMRVLCWKTMRQFALLGKRGGRFRKLYERNKEWYSKHSKYSVALEDPSLCPRYETCVKRLKKAASRLGREEKTPACKRHIDLMAKRKTIKEFVKELFLTWRKLLGLPDTLDYETAILKGRG